MKKDIITEEQAKNTKAGGVLVGKRKGQTIIHDKGTEGGYFVGKLHSEGGIKGINKSTGQPIEVQGGEVIITAPAVADQTKRMFDGQMLTNREILSKINEKGGGVSFANGGDVPKEIFFNGSSYNYGGDTMADYEVLIKMNSFDYKKLDGVSKNKSLLDIAKKHKVDLSKIESEFKLGVKVESEHSSDRAIQEAIAKDHLFENPNYYTKLNALKLSDGGNVPNTFWGSVAGGVLVYCTSTKRFLLLKRSQYVFEPNTWGIISGKIDDGESSIEQAVIREAYEETGYELKTLHPSYVFKSGNFTFYNFIAFVDKEFRPNLNWENTSYGWFELNDFPKNLHFGLQKLMENEELDKVGVKQENSDFSFLEEIEIVFKNGGKIDLVKESENGDHPSRDLNNFNDVLDIGADGFIGANNGLEFEDGGTTKELVEYINIWEAGDALSNLQGKKYENFKDLKKDLEEINPDDSYIYLGANGKSMGLFINVRRDGKNTNTTINPTTSKAKDFEKVIKTSWGKMRMDIYDLSKWLEDDTKGKRKTKPKPEPEPIKIDLEATRKYLILRVANLTKELNFKKPRLSNEEIGFYQRDINNLIQKLRLVYEEQLKHLPISERLNNAYSLKWGDIKTDYTPASDFYAPNGMQTKLTHQEWLNTRNDGFASFFGDWLLANETNDFSGVSKVIDPETKEPMPVYHGTNVLFTEWKTYKTNNAHYFAVNRDFSTWFAEQWSKGRGDVSAKDSNLLKAVNPNKGEYVYRCFLDIKNPIDFSRFGVEKRPISDFIMFLQINYNIGDFDFWTNFRLFNNLTQDTLVYSWMIIRNWQSFTEYIKMATTYDGYIFYEYHPEKVGTGIEGASLSYCAFDSSQIKFTTATEFNSLIKDSRFDKGGKI